MTEATKQFDFRDLLSITSRRMTCETLDEICDVLQWMTGERPYTHQICRFADECVSYLNRWFPELEAANQFLPDLDRALEGARLGNFSGGQSRQIVNGWLIRVQVDCGIKDTYDVPRIPMDDHTRIDPERELVAMVGRDRVVIITNGDSE